MRKYLPNLLISPIFVLTGCSIVHLPPKDAEPVVTEPILERSTDQEQTPTVDQAKPQEEPKPQLSQTLFFLNDSVELTLESQALLLEFLRELESKTFEEIRVVGHTDTQATSTYNDQLSIRRADKITEKLVESGIDTSLVRIEGRGEQELLIPTADGISDVRNRRVTIELW